MKRLLFFLKIVFFMPEFLFAIEIMPVKPISGRPYLHDKEIPSASLLPCLRFIATPGEYESASFVMRSASDISNVKVLSSHLTNSHGAIISAKQLTIKVVKIWYQAAPAWKDIDRKDTDHSQRVAVPELLLNDDSLVKVDHQKKINYVRLGGKFGGKYVNISTGRTDYGVENADFPVADAKKLLPFDLAANENKQIWLTLHVPEQAIPGNYQGKLTFYSDGQFLKDVPIECTVLPFKLDQLTTYYDCSKPFVSSIYYKGILGREGSVNRLRDEEQYRADLQDLRAHGVTHPLFNQLIFKKDFTGMERALKIRQEEGIAIDPLYLLGPERNLSCKDLLSSKEISKTLEYLSEIKKITEKFGIKDIYVYGIDESKGQILSSQKNIWKSFHEKQIKIFQAGYMHFDPTSFALVGNELDLLVCAGEPQQKYAKQWHSLNHDIWCYAFPQGGVENPEVYRRNFGLRLWLEEYDGACTYIYNDGFGHPWDDFDHERFRDHNFVYGTVDGKIGTISWEGYREGIDDIRYAVTLMNEVKKQPAHPSSQKAFKLFKTVTKGHRDLDVVRSEMIALILSLKK